MDDERVYHFMSTNLVTLLPQLGYKTPFIIVNNYDQRYVWLLESGCQGPFEFPDDVLTDPQLAEDNQIDVNYINQSNPKDTSHVPVEMNVKGILELLKELSGKEYFMLLMADCQDEFCCLDDLDGWEVLKDSFNRQYQRRGDGTWGVTFDMSEDYEGGGEIIALSEQMIKDIISHL
jgi:hypothetical protein